MKPSPDPSLLPFPNDPAIGELRCCDNMTWMPSLPDGCCRLIYVDPPFNTGRTRSSEDGRHRYDDCFRGGPGASPIMAPGPSDPDGDKTPPDPPAQLRESALGLAENALLEMAPYLDFLAPRLSQMRRLLDEQGTLWVHLDWHAVHYVKVLLDGIFGRCNFVNEIIWSYRTGGNSRQWFARKHDTILVYAANLGRHCFNPQRGGSFRTDGMNYDEQGRPYKSTVKGRLYFDPQGPLLTDVWDLPFLSTVAVERTGYPSQKPEALLQRIIAAGSNPGDRVADFFCGSGTLPAVAQRTGRKWLACDSSEQAVELARRRIDG